MGFVVLVMGFFFFFNFTVGFLFLGLDLGSWVVLMAMNVRARAY